MSIKMQEEYGDKIQVVFVSGGRDTPEQVQAFALKKKWLGGRAMWTNEAPFETGLGYIPSAVVLSSQGEVLLVGNPLEKHGEIVDLIEDDIDAAKKGPKDAPDAVKKAWGEFSKGSWAKALAAAQAVIDKPPAKDGDAAVAAAKAALESFNKAIDGRFAVVDLAVENGLFERALSELEAIAKAAKGSADLTQRHADALAKLNGPDLKAERDASAELAKLEKKLYGSGPDSGVAKALTALAEKHAGTKAAARAENLARIAEEED